MGRGKKPTRSSGAMLASEAARALLKQDFPEVLKVKIRLATRGGRPQRRRCLGCGAQGQYIEIYTPYTVMRPMGDGGEGIKIYWTCSKCYEKGLTPALEQKLKEECR